MFGSALTAGSRAAGFYWYGMILMLNSIALHGAKRMSFDSGLILSQPMGRGGQLTSESLQIGK
jgi:hypothetical protein